MLILAFIVSNLNVLGVLIIFVTMICNHIRKNK